MSVIIEIETGFVCSTHQYDTGLSVEEWNELDDEEKEEILSKYEDE